MNRVFNTSELLTMDLHNAAIKELGESLVAQLATPKEEMGKELDEGEDEKTPYLDPIEQYDVAHALLEIAKYVAYVAGVQANTYCERKKIGLDGKHFQHKNGIWHERQVTYEYNNFDGNDFTYLKDEETGEKIINPETGKPITIPLGYREAQRKIGVATGYLNELKKDLSDAKKDIISAHPDMKKRVTCVTFKYHGYKDGGPVVWGSKIQTAAVPKEEECTI